MSFREYTWSAFAQRQAEETGVERTRVREMARLSAPFTHSRWNRRFENWVFRIEGDRVVEFGEMPEPKRTRKRRTREKHEWARGCTICRGSCTMTVYEEHEHCDGDGCDRCDNGMVRKRRPCPAIQNKEQVVCSDKL